LLLVQAVLLWAQLEAVIMAVQQLLDLSLLQVAVVAKVLLVVQVEVAVVEHFLAGSDWVMFQQYTHLKEIMEVQVAQAIQEYSMVVVAEVEEEQAA
jgi:hypothetical protein